MRNRIYMSDRTVNRERKFGSALTYVPVRVVRVDIRGDARIESALFTHDQIAKAHVRALENPEDVPVISRWERFRIGLSVLFG